MKLLVGLGNPGEKYAKNRHNVGFMFLDYASRKLEGGIWKADKKYEAEMCSLKIDQKEFMLVKPQTFMNDSGRAVGKMLSNNQFSITNKFSISNDLFVIHDDLDIQLGQYKIQLGKGPQLHNGIESIEHHLKTKEFTRVRIGVDNRDPEYRVPGEKYVLQDFNNGEFTIISDVFSRILQEFLI